MIELIFEKKRSGYIKEIRTGIWQEVCQSHKYKTNMLIVKFIVPYDEQLAAYLTLLAQMMESGSVIIQSRSEVEQFLVNLYGAHLDIAVRRQGQYLEYTVSSSTVREDLLPNTIPLIKKWYELIVELLFNQEFDLRSTERFEREKALLIQRRLRQKDDKSYQVVQKLFEKLYTEDSRDICGSQGSLKALEQASLSNIADAYQRLKNEGQVCIVMHGVIDETRWVNWLEQLPLVPRNVQIDYHDNHLRMLSQPYQLWQETVVSEQANLIYAYSFQPVSTLVEILTATLANALFGALPTSELFVSIREQKSLAYHIVSTIDFQRQLVLVSAGIVNDKGEIVEQAIDCARYHLMQTLDETKLKQAKTALLSYEVQNQDLQETALIQLLSKQMLPEYDLSLENYQAIFEKITVCEVIECLKQWRPLGCYILKGGSPD